MTPPALHFGGEKITALIHCYLMSHPTVALPYTNEKRGKKSRSKPLKPAIYEGVEMSFYKAHCTTAFHPHLTIFCMQFSKASVHPAYLPLVSSGSSWLIIPAGWALVSLQFLLSIFVNEAEGFHDR